MKQPKPVFFVLSALLVALVCFAYAHFFHNPFHFDDEHTIVTNTYIRNINNIPLFFKDATTFSSLPANQAWRPGVTTLDAIDCWLGGKPDPDPFYYHVHMFIDFLLLGVFIYFFAFKVFELAFKNELNPYIALLVTSVFMLHTANVETISYIISRSDSDSTLFILISLCVFAYYRQWRKYLLYLIPMFIGFTIKEPTVMIGPLILLLIAFFEEGLSLSEALVVVWVPVVFLILPLSTFIVPWILQDIRIFFWALLLEIPLYVGLYLKGVLKPDSGAVKLAVKIYRSVWPAFALALILFLVSQHFTPPTWSSGGTNRIDYLITETFVMVHYVNNYFFPFNLSADTDWGLITSIFDDRAVIGILFILTSLGLAYWASLQQKSRPITYGILWFYLTLLPTSSVIPFSEVLNDHRVFFPYIGLTIATVWALFLLYKKHEEFIKRNTIIQYIILLFIALFLSAHIYGVRTRVKVWSDEALLWKDVTIKSPHNGRGLMNYGLVLMSKGDYKGALDYYTRAKQEWPYYSYLYVNLGVLNSVMGNAAESEKNFQYALQLNPQNPNCYFYYAIMLKTNGRIDEAKQRVTQGLALSPKHTDLVRFNNELNSNPIYAGAIKSKIELMESTAKQNPTPENYLNLSLEYYNNGRFLDCVHASEEALKLKPDYNLAYNNICSAYNVLHEWDKAIAAGRKAVELDPSSQLAKNNLQVSLDGKKAGN